MSAAGPLQLTLKYHDEAVAAGKKLYNKIFDVTPTKSFVGKSNLLQNPFDVKKNDGTPFQVFTPFWKNAEIHYLNNNAGGFSIWWGTLCVGAGG